jgi:hypothetical protein
MEQLILIAMVLLLGFINMIVRHLGQASEASTPGEEAPKAPSRVELPRAARIVTPSPPAALLPQVRAKSSPPPIRRRSAAGEDLGSRVTARRAIVTMTILGPCRAREGEPNATTLEPPGT